MSNTSCVTAVIVFINMFLFLEIEFDIYFMAIKFHDFAPTAARTFSFKVSNVNINGLVNI